jgi:hypothetical protein
MIDYTKILLKNIDLSRLKNLSILDFNIVVSEKTGELSDKRIANYHFCKITVYDSGIVLFTGSIHKMWNSLNDIKAPNFNSKKEDKGFNGNQFTINDIFEVRRHLQELFNCDNDQMVFQNIEFGFNITTLFDPQIFIRGLLYHYGILFEFRFNRFYAQVIHERYLLKIYNKSNQYGMKNHTIRIELKVIKTEDIKSTGIKTFADINKYSLNKAKELLLKRFDEVVYYDNTILTEELTKRQKQTLNQYSNPRYWIEKLNPKNRHYNKAQLKKYIIKHSNNLHLQIVESIIEKFGIINRLSTDHKFGTINSSSIKLNYPIKQSRYCPITGVNISIQKEGSYLLSHGGLKQLYSFDRIKFEEVKREHLSKKWLQSDYETQIKEIAHNIRDTIKNRVVKQNRLYPPNQNTLFAINEINKYAL